MGRNVLERLSLNKPPEVLAAFLALGKEQTVGEEDLAEEACDILLRYPLLPIDGLGCATMTGNELEMSENIAYFDLPV